MERYRVRAEPTLEYFIQRPPAVRPDSPVLVSVHGISRNALAHAELLAPYAARMGMIVVAPAFGAAQFPDYQRLGCRADRALLNVLHDMHDRFQLDVNGVRLFGYSGGAQFSHRFAMLYPSRVASLALGAAGWYTFPDESRVFPQGVLMPDAWSGPAVDLEGFLQLPIRICVGALDRVRDAQLNRSQRVDRQQGANRIERAARWVAALRNNAIRRGIACDIRLQRLPGARHCFEQNVETADLGQWVVNALQ